MSRYITIRLTLAQAQAACNAADLIRDQLEASGNAGEAREAALYARASAAIDTAIREQSTASKRRTRRARATHPNIFDDLFAGVTS